LVCFVVVVFFVVVFFVFLVGGIQGGIM